MGCTSGAMKCVLNILNTINAIFGILLIALATVSLGSAPSTYIYYLYIIGGVIFIASMLGCCGICQESVCLTLTYAIIILCLLIVQIVGKFYTLDSAAIKKFASDDVEKTWQDEILHPGAMNKTQQTYECCGRFSPNDYFTIARRIPLSCYPHSVVNQTALYRSGCIMAAEDHFTQLFNYSSSGQWGSLIFTIVMCVFAFYLVVRFRRKQRHYNY